MPRRLTSARPSISAALTLVALAALLAVPAPAAAGSRSADQDIADESVVTAADVPSEFAQAPAGRDETPTRGPRCAAITKAAKALNTVPHREVAFRQATAALINNQVSVFGTAKAAKAAYAAYASKQAATCFEQGFEEEFAKQLDDPNAEVQVNILPYEPDLGDASVGYDLEIGLAANGSTGVVYASLEIARLGRAVNAFGFIQENELFSSDTIDQVTAAGMQRLEQAL